MRKSIQAGTSQYVEMCKVIKKIISYTATFLLLTPFLIFAVPLTIPSTPPEVVPPVVFALDFAGGNFWYLDHGYNELTYFSFYSFFKCGIEPDCIDIVADERFMVND